MLKDSVEESSHFSGPLRLETQRGAQWFPGRRAGEHLLHSRSLWTSEAITGLNNAARNVLGKCIEQQKSYGPRKTGGRGKMLEYEQDHKEKIGGKEEVTHLLEQH